MGSNSTSDFLDIMDQLSGEPYNVPKNLIYSLTSYTMGIYRSEEENKYSKPMLWIGMYIALASLICILAMVGDLLHGLRARKLWFPCKYFTIHAASLTVIGVAMKLPVDLTTSMPGNVDQVAKLGSLAFMCSMMANLLPSLATMDSKELLSNIAALVVMVITLVVNICIQIATGVVSYDEKVKIYQTIKPDLDPKSLGTYVNLNKITATVYVTLLLMLLIIHICSSLAILKSKQIIESKYQVHARDLKDQKTGRLTPEELKQHVSKYWIMAGTGSPQFITVCSATTSASGVICVLSTILHIFTVLKISPKLKSKYCESDYQWSMSVILVTQFIGVVVGTIAPLCRWFAALSFKMSIKQIWNHNMVFETERYWIQKFSDWKRSSMPVPFRCCKGKVVIENLKFIILNFLIDVQKAVVVTCKMISVIPCFFMMCVLFMMYCLRCLKRENSQQQQQQQNPIPLEQNPIPLENTQQQQQQQQNQIPLENTQQQQQQQQQQQNSIPPEQGEKNTHQPESHEDLQKYVLQLDKEQELHEKTLKSLLKSVNSLILKAEKRKPKKLEELLEKSSGFEGILKFDNDHVPTILKFDNDHVPNISSKEFLDCWSLPVVTLTAIVVSLPKIQKEIVDKFLKNVNEAFMYVTLVEKSLNAASDYVSIQSIQKAAKTLWLEVEIYHKWLGYKLKDCAFTGCNNLLSPKKKDPASEVSVRDILQWFSKTAKEIVEVGSRESGGPNDDSICRSICANSMYRISETIILSYQANIDKVSQEVLFTELSSMISDIVAACLTNLPQVIALKCHSKIEKREAKVHAAAQLLGETTEIIKVLQKRPLPMLNPDDFPFIHKWRTYLRHP